LKNIIGIHPATWQYSLAADFPSVVVQKLADVNKPYESNEEQLIEADNQNNGTNTNIYSYLETSGGQSSDLYLNVVHFLNDSVN
jgi:hypothetical protein